MKDNVLRGEGSYFVDCAAEVGVLDTIYYPLTKQSAIMVLIKYCLSELK